MNPRPENLSKNREVSEYEPPAGMTDPFIRRARVDRATWNRAIRGRLGHISRYAVARALADYGNKDGGNCHPGVARLAEELNCSRDTALRALGWLREYGWLHVERRGSRKTGQADSYVLTVPAPIAADMDLWREGEPVWLERPASEPKRRFLGSTGATCNSQVLSSTDATCNGFLGSKQDFLGSKQPFLSSTGATPPGSYHQGSYHHSDSVNPPRAAARGATKLPPDFDPEDMDADLALIEYVERLVGGPLRADTEQLIGGMLADGRNPIAIVNAAVKHETEAA